VLWMSGWLKYGIDRLLRSREAILTICQRLGDQPCSATHPKRIRTIDRHTKASPCGISRLPTELRSIHAVLGPSANTPNVHRYPEVLDYFYSLIELRLPDDRSREVVQPPFAAAGYADRGYADPARLAVKEKKKKRRDREGSAVPENMALHRMMRGPPPVPTPPIPHGGAYPRPPERYPAY
jgi:hypothetical protein